MEGYFLKREEGEWRGMKELRGGEGGRSEGDKE